MTRTNSGVDGQPAGLHDQVIVRPQDVFSAGHSHDQISRVRQTRSRLGDEEKQKSVRVGPEGLLRRVGRSFIHPNQLLDKSIGNRQPGKRFKSPRELRRPMASAHDHRNFWEQRLTQQIGTLTDRPIASPATMVFRTLPA